MNDRPELDDDELRDLLARRAIRARTDGMLASVRSAAAMAPQRRPRLPGFGLVRPRVAAGVAALASLAVLVVVAALAAGGRVPAAGFVTGSASPSASAVALGSAQPPATPVAPGVGDAVLPLTTDQLNAILLPNSSALVGRQLVITGTIELNWPVILGGPCCSPRPDSQQAILVGSIPSLGFAVTGGGTPLPAALPFTGTFAATMRDTRTLEYGGAVRLASSGGAFLPSQLPKPANTARGGLWLAQGWIAGFDHPFPCPSFLGPFIGPRYNGCGAQSSLSDTGSQPVSGETFRVPSGGILIQDRAYDDFAPDPHLTGAGTQPEQATFLVYAVLVARCGNCLITADDYHWAIATRIDPWPVPGQTAPPTTAPAPSPTAIQSVQPLTVSQLNTFMAMNSQSPAGRQLVITGTIAGIPAPPGPPPGSGCRYSGRSWTCPPAYLIGSEPRLSIEPIGDIGPGPWAAGGPQVLTGTFAATLDGFTLDYQGPVATTPGGDAWLPSQLPSPSKPGVVGSYWLVHGWISSPAISPACGTQLRATPYPSPFGLDYGCDTRTLLSDDASNPDGPSASALQVQNDGYQEFGPWPASTQGGDVPEEATFLLRSVGLSPCAPTEYCAMRPADFHWAVVARIGPWPVPDVNPPPRGSCQASDVQVSFDGWGPAEGSTYAQLRVAFAGALGSPCSVLAAPGVAIVDAEGQTLVSASAVGGDTVVLSGALEAELGWLSWCKPLPSGPLTLQLDFGSAVVNAQLPDGFGASCAGTATKVFLIQDLHAP